MDEFILVFVTTSSREEAEKIANKLIDVKAAPCINIIPSCLSIYEWQGGISRDEESLMIIKSNRASFSKIKEVIELLHSYDVPEVIAVSAGDISEKYRFYLEGFFKGAE
jgi:periplasmic divalent cation tolerance protein